MTDDATRAEIEAARSRGAFAARMRKVRGLPRETQRALEEVPKRRSDDANNVYFHHREALASTMRGLSESARSRRLRRLFPAIAPWVEAGWRALARRPFQGGSDRRPFRCPRSASDLDRAASDWAVDIAMAVGDFDRDIVWVAKHGGALSGWRSSMALAWLFAGVLDVGDATSDEVFEILKDAATGGEGLAATGRHVSRTLLASSREDAWEFVEKLLLAAQREEGLRQSILEAVDESHPSAFRRMLEVIREERLARFSAVVRAADVWFGFQWDGASAIKIDDILRRVAELLDDPAARESALDGDDAESAYLALWTMAYDDIEVAVPRAARLLDDAKAEKRFVATHLLAESLWKDGVAALAPALDDSDLRVAGRALFGIGSVHALRTAPEGIFERLERLLARLHSRSTKLESIVWPWWEITLERSAVVDAMVRCESERSSARLLPYVKHLSPYGRADFVRELAGLSGRSVPGSQRKEPRRLRGEAHGTALELLGDPSADAREAAFEALAGTPIDAVEVDRLVDLLGRKAGDLRNRAVARLSGLDDRALSAAAERLLGDKSAARRTAGLELLRGAVESGRLVDASRARVEAYRSSAERLTDEERTHVDAILGGEAEVATRDDALGLIDPGSLPEFPAPRTRRFETKTGASEACFEALAGLVLEHADHECAGAAGGKTRLVELGSSFPGVATLERRIDASADQAPGDEEHRVPLAEVWKQWIEGRSAELRDDDGLELVRAYLLSTDPSVWKTPNTRALAREESWYWSPGRVVLRALLGWCVRWSRPPGALDLALDGLETEVASLRAVDYRVMAERKELLYVVSRDETAETDRRVERVTLALRQARALAVWLGDAVDESAVWRLYSIVRWVEKRCGGYHRITPTLGEFAAVYRSGALGAAGVAELMDGLVGPCADANFFSWLDRLSGPKLPHVLAGCAEVADAVERCRRRLVELETARGDRETAASAPVLRLRSSGGLETLARALEALGSTPFARSFSWRGGERSRKETLSHLVIKSAPREGDSPEAFADWARRARIPEKRLVDLAAYAPQWARHVATVLEWPGLESSVWWLHAHTKSDRWSAGDERLVWAAQVSEQTPLSAQDLSEGAVDVAWFQRAHAEVGADRWAKLHRAAKFASNGGGHKRAQLFAEAMLGEAEPEALRARIDAKRHQDSVRALGLVPLPRAKKARRDETLARYLRLQEFVREGRKFGAQRRESEKRAVEIALQNLARTAGYRDPLRLQWAMEMETTRDLASGRVELEKDGVTITLSIDDEGTPDLATRRGERALKAVPAKLRKDPEVVELRERAQELRRQASRVKVALEQAMCRGDEFEAAELRDLLGHPVLAPSLRRLVFVGEGIAGYPVEGARALEGHDGTVEPIKASERLRVAHPLDLLERGDWSAWQGDCFRRERIQPIKQVFREVYSLTETERDDRLCSHRYAGHQVQPRQAIALLGARGWVVQPGEGISRTHHEANLTARLELEEAFYTPAEVEGLTLDAVWFSKKGQSEPVELESIPPRLLSETLRDIDLVVSVAHRGEVDPEASASTIEMRASLLREAVDLLRLENVDVQGSYAYIRGGLAEYAVHLGSALASVRGGAALVIVAVHSQHRGRLFLPFADDDPRTAEVMAKCLLLARDGEIRDPSILEQIREVTGG